MHDNDPSGLDGIPPEALDPKTTPFDYIVVGSGAGGGPLACRLAQAGMKVLVLEAGIDPGAPLPAPNGDAATQRKAENQRLIYHCPGLHAAASEPHQHTKDDAAQTSWGFEVKHYSDTAKKPAYYYPRASALGGCTAHHAMISTYGADYDWQRIADLTGDDSWAPGKMRAIYQRIERARYGNYRSPIGQIWDRFLDWVNPARNVSGERGESGWLEITMTDPKLAMDDRQLWNLITGAVLSEERLDRVGKLWRWFLRLLGGMLYRDFDLNDEATMRESPEGVALVPLGVSCDGVRRGPRELLLETRSELLKEAGPFIGALRIATGVFVRRVLFDCSNDGAPPSAAGVEFEQGRHLYEASPFFDSKSQDVYPKCFARREIILCGGAFNTPQLLMLSGIGEKEHLKEMELEGLACINGSSGGASCFINLPGVGQNLQDRCEISVISEMACEFKSLDGVEFTPGASSDRALDRWKANDVTKPRSGIYTTNGAALAILKRSHKAVVQPDLLMFGFPAAFRGYYPGWSKDLLAREKGCPEKKRNLWSWVILKAYSVNCGSVRLQSKEPSAVPAINFRYFGDCWDTKQNQWNIDEKNDDLAALQHAVAYVRRLNQHASKLMKGGDAASAEIQPGDQKPQGSRALCDWIVQEAWGHHASGTCRIGTDPWQADPANLKDKGAVLDSRFRVHGVRGLRVVDASVFPKIPGYFIVVPIYMISEKAADTILNELSV